MKTDWSPFKSSLDGLCDRLERAGDAWRESLNELAEAENKYRRAHATAWLKTTAVAVTIRAKDCENQPDVVAARTEWVMAGAREKAAHSKVEEQRNRVMAAMSDQKYLGQADGG